MINPQLTTFLQVAASGSFSKAAEELYVTPTAVMKQINALEERLGFSLFDRTNHGLRLTKAGECFLQDSRYVTDYAARAEEKAREIAAKEERKSIRIGTSIMTPAKFVLDIWEEIRDRDADFKIELIPFENNAVNSREILKNLGRHIDIVAGLYDDGFLAERGCNAAHLYDKKILLAVPVTNPLSKRESLSVEDLRKSGVMMIQKGWNRYIDGLREECLGQGVHVEDFDQFSINAYNRAVRENIPIITVEGWEEVHPLLRMVSTKWEHRIPFGILYSPSPTRLIQKFINAVLEINRNR